MTIAKPKVKGYMKLLSMSEMGDPQPPRWLVKPLLLRRTVAMLYGPAGSGKSFAILSMALAIATGREWFGHRTTKGPTVYVVGEGSDGIHARAFAWRQRYGSDAPDAKFILHPVMVANEDERAAFIAAMKPLHPVLVILDTLSTMTPGLDENESSDMSLFLGGCREIANVLDACVVVVHHPTKSNPEGYRGSYRLQGDLDTLLNVQGSLSPNGYLDISISCAKQKDSRFFPEVKLSTTLEVIKEAQGEDDAIESLVVIPHEAVAINSKLKPNEQLTLDMAKTLGEGTFTTQQLVAAVDAARGKDSKSSIKNVWLPSLVARSLIERIAEGIYRVSTTANPVIFH